MSSDEEEFDCTPPELRQMANSTEKDLVPQKSKDIYWQEYNTFIKWTASKKVTVINPNVVLAYFNELSQKYSPSSLWKFRSILKSTILIKHGIKIEEYYELTSLLKSLSKEFPQKKSNVLKVDEITLFLKTAPDDSYLLTKVALVFGIYGCCRHSELLKITINDVVDFGSHIKVSLFDTKTKPVRSFIIEGQYLDLVKTYMALRPKSATSNRFFLRYEKNKCFNQAIGKNKIGSMPMSIALFLNLENPASYTGHAFRRSSTTLAADSETNLKRLGEWSSSKVEGYIQESMHHKKNTSKHISNIIAPNSRDLIVPEPEPKRSKLDEVPLSTSYTSEQPFSFSTNVTEEDEIAAIDYELRQIENELQKLEDRKKVLLDRKQRLKDNALLKKSLTLSKKNWNAETFSWSKNLKKALVDIFKIKELRPLQLQTMNAFMSKEDVILIMPTGGGKSLCYQLPAVVSKGVTIVVSPLVALMEDQLHGLHKLKVNAKMLSSKAPKDDVKAIMTGLIDNKSDLKLVYVTPEYMAKSNRFMSKLQKAFEMNRLDHFAIDEVHCCSQWGHDFRPDYKFLGILKSMFPGVPILGLTATAPAKIIVDVQKMLDIQGCLVLRASFNRPNLFYEVRRKPSDKDTCLEMIVSLLKNRFEGKSGIIYTTTIKEAETITADLRSRGLRIGCYHAILEPQIRTKVYNKWIIGEYQAVVATIAFGLGIDKPDVRFVIHHCLSKSMENFYQESGRAGRDGEKSYCILLYRLADVFKLSTMVFQDKVGLQNLYKILSYCLDQRSCRRSLIATHFEETWTKDDCKEMCDHCRKDKKKKEIDVAPYCRYLYQIMTKAVQSEQRLTVLKLVDAWYNKGAVDLRVASVPTPKFPREIGEAIVGHLFALGYLQEDFHFSAYSTISYVKRGPKSGLVMDKDYKIMIEVEDY